MTSSLPSATSKVRPELAAIVTSLQAGMRIKVTQTVRVGARTWTTAVSGVYRGLDFLATGLATQRVKEDDIVVPVLHFTKDNGELSSIAIDEHTIVERLA